VTTTITYAASGDGYLTSQHSTYTTMQAGNGVTITAAATTAAWGRKLDAGVYYGYQAFLTFTYSIPTEQVTGAYVRLKSVSVTNSGTNRDLRLYSFAFGTLAAADWRTPTQLAALPNFAEYDENNEAGSDLMYAGSDELSAHVVASGTLELVGSGSNFLAGTAPTIDETATFRMSEQTGTADDPALVFSSVALSTLWPVLGAQVQLADGSWAYLQSDGTLDPAVTIKHCTTGGTVTTVATLPTGTLSSDFYVAGTTGAQGLALCVDSSDNLYVIGKIGNADNSLAAKGYTKGVGYTWTAQTTRSWPLVSYDSRINGCAAAWHSYSSGTIMAVFSHGPGTAIGGTGGNELAYAMLDATYLRTGAGSLMRNHDAAMNLGVQPQSISGADWNAFANEVGSGLDVTWAGSGNAAWGYVYSFVKSQNVGDNAELYPGRYVLSGSTGFAHASVDNGGHATKDASAKVRAVKTSASTVAYVMTDADTGWGLTVVVLQYSGLSYGAVELAYQALAGASITNMPDGPAISVASWWDVIYNSVSNTLEIYFRDSANARILRRTTFSLTTMLPLANSTVVYTNASGTATIQAVRVARNADAATKGLLCIACKDGATLSLVNVIDTFNLAPTAPTLTPEPNFDATTAQTFAWTFNDPNVGDTQSAYEFEVYRTDTGASVIDTGKVVSATSSRNVTGSTLTNALSYRWRVRTWDAADEVSPWSAYGTFSTSTGGTVTITDPASDNPAGVITDDYGIDWSVAGTTQAAYRVWLKVHSTGATVNDSGWVTSAATTYNVTGMASGVESRIEVKVRNVGLVESATGTRLITPDYGSPEVPTIVVSSGDGYVLVAVDNPAPTGDKPEVTRNDILRRTAGGTTWYLIGSCDADSEFRDYTAAAGVSYDYIARGTA
jgi:hypothetical protein